MNDTIAQSVRQYWEQLTWCDISEHFGDKTTGRGRSYGEGGNVESLWATTDGRTLLAEVSGSYDYKTCVSLQNGRRKNQFVLHSKCSCPVGIDCKHGVATVTKFLDMLAKNTPIPLCIERENDTWETYSSNGKKKTSKIDFEEYDYLNDEDDEWDNEYDEDDWDDEEDEDYDGEAYSPKKRNTKTKTETKSGKSSAKKDDFTVTLSKKLKTKSSAELVDMILKLSSDYDDVREHFKQEAFAESVSESGDTVKLVEKTIHLIDKGFKNISYDYYDRYGGPEEPDLDPVEKIIRQFARLDDPLSSIDHVARYLIKKGTKYAEESGAEDTDEIDGIFDVMAGVLLASKSKPVDIILWAHDITGVGEYDLAGYAAKKILEHAWPVKVWSGVADALLERMRKDSTEKHSYWMLRTVAETLDKAKRQTEATDLLRKEAGKAQEYDMLAERLIAFGFLDEAEKLVLQQRAEEMKNARDYRSRHRGDEWVEKLKTIAEKRKDWNTLASLQAAEFFESPRRQNIEPLIKTTRKLKLEPIIRKGMQEFLRTGEYPDFVAQSLEGTKPTPKARKCWPIPFFAFHPERKKPEPRFDILCEWAIDEKRPKDVLHWFDEYSKRKNKNQNLSRREVADAIAETHPERAFGIYRERAEYEMETTRNYPEAVRMLRKSRLALEKQGRSAEWPKIMEEIRATHRRKPSLMKQLDEFEAGSIVKQKRR